MPPNEVLDSHHTLWEGAAPEWTKQAEEIQALAIRKALSLGSSPRPKASRPLDIFPLLSPQKVLLVAVVVLTLVSPKK
jgi:hypothetical protein